ncbi:MAG TPA: hypothetical protein VFV80_13360, partial [Geminicoccaceae bacterium]|nr:hypothetical protein [Geminicoccaceae bacterium]
GLAHGSARLLEDEDLRRGMAANARKRAREFTLERHVARLTAVYEAAAGAPPIQRSRPATDSPAHGGEAWSPGAET